MLKQNSPIKSFQLFEGRTQTKTLGLILIIALFFIGIIIWVGTKVKNDIDKANQNSTVIYRKNNGGSRFPNSLGNKPLSEEAIQSQLRELEAFKNSFKPLSEKEIQEQLKEMENLRKK